MARTTYNKERVIKACRELIDKHNDETTLYELLEGEVATGLTFYECELVCSALDNYYSGAKTFWRSGSESIENDTTPYDIVKTLKTMDNLNTNDRNTLYYQVTACDRWGYDMGSDSNADYFDNILRLVVEGKPQEAFMIANDNGISGFDPVEYGKIIDGQANNGGEHIVYNDFYHIMTISADSYTIYRKLTEQELQAWNESK